MTTTPAKKRSAFAALGLSLALILGVFVPFFATTSSASAASVDCSSEGAGQQAALDHYKNSARQLTHAQKKLSKDKKALKKAKKRHASHSTIVKGKKKVKKDKRKVATYTTRFRSAGAGVGAANGALVACRAKNGTLGNGTPATVIDGPLANTPLAPICELINLPGVCTTATPDPAVLAAQLQSLLGTLTDGLSPATLSDPVSYAQAVEAAFNSLVSALNPGGGSLVADLEKTLDDLVTGVVKILGNGSSSLPTDPTQILSLLTGGLSSGLPAGSGVSTDALNSIPVLGPILSQLIDTLLGSVGGGLPL